MNNPAKLSKYEIWLMASRPKTLLAAFVPVIVGSSIAHAEHSFSLLAAVTALICSLLIQVGTNFVNDLYDYLKGADTKKRLGPTRVLAAGLVTPRQMKSAIAWVFGTAFLLGLYLVYRAGYPILIVGILSLISGFAYTGGPYPLAYHGLGDIFVFLFFGIVATNGMHYVHTQHFSFVALLASFPVGALITNILIVNNYRDIDQDRVAGKFTLAVYLGKTFSRVEYIVLLAGSFVVPLLIYLFYDVSIFIFLPYLTLPIAYKLILMLLTVTGTQLNKALELTAKFSALFGVLFALGFVL